MPLLSNLFGSLAVWWGLGGTDNTHATIWMLTMVLLVAADVATGPPLRQTPIDAARANRDYQQAIMICGLYGLLWGALVLFFYGTAGVEERQLIAIIITAYLASSALVLAAVPGAVVAFSAPIIVQAVPALIIDGIDRNAFLLQMLGVYLIVYPLTLRQYWRSMDERFHAISRVAEQNHMIRVLLDDFETNSDDWLWQADAELRITRVSESFLRQTEVDTDHIVGLTAEAFIAASLTVDGEPDPGASVALERMRDREPFRDVPVVMMVDGEERCWSVSGSPVRTSDGVFDGYRGIGRNVTEKRRAERELRQLAHHDPLTGAPNRTRFNQRLVEAAMAVAREGRRFALVQIDLDDFKAVNDTAGHATGDKVLEAAYRRCVEHLPANAFMARIGGDEFAALIELDVAAGPDAVRELVTSMVDAVSEPFETSCGLFRIGASAGIALMPDNAADPGMAMRLADIALYNAKSDDVTRVHLASQDEALAYAHRKRLQRDLRQAVERNELSLFFQPVVDAVNGRTLVMEALLRWRHAEFGYISPTDFIPIAEQTGSIREIGAWALREACRHAVLWPETVRVAVNISPRQLGRDDLAKGVMDTLRETGLEPRRLEIEITESAFLCGVEHVRDTVLRLKSHGITVAMDDFGTGYSSLSSLQHVPFNKLKIDRSLVARDRGQQRTVSILKSIVAIGRALDLQVTAEGVETGEQAAFLRALGCDSLQGYFFARPMPAEDLAAYFAGDTLRTLAAARQPRPSAQAG